MKQNDGPPATFKGFTVGDITALELACKDPLAEMYTLSPFVWREGAGAEYKLLLRAVPRSNIAAEKIARV
ncbi:MAG: hypothetical protein M3T49_02905, partial [Candidatus Eremiobacteraeota bacterium]|nr:hypothetical protein [Candidatus Eremiobacteraeota bacterium]